MKTLLIVGFVIVCVIANESMEKEDEKSSESKSSEVKSSEVKPGAHPPAPGAHPLECKKNETSGCQPCGPEKSCHSSAAPPHEPTACTTECKPACVCAEGHVKGPDGNCILVADCPKS
ncbi:hypothetical protein RB195_003726 [Necator americanus]|uniref:Trypsin Inhibitor like cysteine rich domain protein n=1 Tax=Necator americanus TaxID=51031 RepID=A0ABR1DPW3_NECAM